MSNELGLGFFTILISLPNVLRTVFGRVQLDQRVWTRDFDTVCFRPTRVTKCVVNKQRNSSLKLYYVTQACMKIWRFSCTELALGLYSLWSHYNKFRPVALAVLCQTSHSSLSFIKLSQQKVS